MHYIKNTKKKIAFILIISILSVNLSFLAVPKKAEAIWGIGDLPMDVPQFGRMVWDYAKKAAWYLAEASLRRMAVRVINGIVRETVNWISGKKGGKPGFPAKFSTFMEEVADEAIGEFIENTPELNFLCDPFRIQVMFALQLGFGAGLREKIGCTLDQVTRNVANAYQTSSVTLDINGRQITESAANANNKKDWNNWLKSTLQPQANPIGSFMVAKTELDARLLTTQKSNEMELVSGKGALSYKGCYDNYYDKNGNYRGQSANYTEGAGGGKAGSVRPAIPAGLSAKPQCTMKTPGATIAGMLDWKSTSDQRLYELRAALGQGINDIIDAVIKKFTEKQTEQLERGVLDPNTQATEAAGAALDDALYAAFVSTQQDITNAGGPNPPIAMPVFPGTTTPFDWSRMPTTGGTSTIPISYLTQSPLDMAKYNALALIKSLTLSEKTYQDNYKAAQNLLTQAKTIFASSSVCNISLNRSDTVLRSLLIRSNVVTNIDGISDSNRSIASIPWNMQVIINAIQDSNANKTILNTATNDVNNAGSIEQVTQAMIQVNSTSFNTDPQTNMIANIETWLRGVRNMYSVSPCLINLDSILTTTPMVAPPTPLAPPPASTIVGGIGQ